MLLIHRGNTFLPQFPRPPHQHQFCEAFAGKPSSSQLEGSANLLFITRCSSLKPGSHYRAFFPSPARRARKNWAATWRWFCSLQREARKTLNRVTLDVVSQVFYVQASHYITRLIWLFPSWKVAECKNICSQWELPDWCCCEKSS